MEDRVYSHRGSYAKCFRVWNEWLEFKQSSTYSKYMSSRHEVKYISYKWFDKEYINIEENYTLKNSGEGPLVWGIRREVKDKEDELEAVGKGKWRTDFRQAPHGSGWRSVGLPWREDCPHSPFPPPCPPSKELMGAHYFTLIVLHIEVTNEGRVMFINRGTRYCDLQNH